MHPTRRQLLLAGASLAVAPTLATAADAPRFVFVILRGGLDGLTAVPVPGDPAFAEARGPLGRFEAFDAAPRPLDGPFALHPLLPQLHASKRHLLAQVERIHIHFTLNCRKLPITWSELSVLARN